jgi:hypothetical protein
MSEITRQDFSGTKNYYEKEDIELPRGFIGRFLLLHPSHEGRNKKPP